jgi:3-hydroxyacyl-CoA dehydrogenase
VAGRSGKATILGSLVNMRDGGFISQHDFHIAGLIAGVLTGGEVDAGTLVSEEYLMTLERQAFCSLLGAPQDAGTHHGYVEHRQAVAQLI